MRPSFPFLSRISAGLALVVSFFAWWPCLVNAQEDLGVYARIGNVDAAAKTRLAQAIIYSEKHPGIPTNFAQLKPFAEVMLTDFEKGTPSDQMQCLKAIEIMTRKMAVSVYEKGMSEREAGELDDDQWVTVLRFASSILPKEMDEDYLKQLESWAEQYPYLAISRCPSINAFSPSALRERGSEFWTRGLQSKNEGIRTECRFLIESQVQNSFAYMEEVSLAMVRTMNPILMMFGSQTMARVNPQWVGHQADLLQLTKQEKVVGADAGERWLHRTKTAILATAALGDGSTGGNRSLQWLKDLESSDPEVRKSALYHIDKHTLQNWGTSAPLRKALEDPNADVRRKAIDVGLETQNLGNDDLLPMATHDDDRWVRQAALNGIDWSLWDLSRDDFHYLQHKNNWIPVLASAGRDALTVDDTLLEMTKPFGYYPSQIYQELATKQLSSNQKLSLVAKLLDADPSQKATTLGIKIVNEIIAEGRTQTNVNGYSGSCRSELKLFEQHAARLSPVVENLMTLIIEQKATRLVPAIQFFGPEAAPVLDDVLSLLESDSREWQGSETALLMAIKAMGPKAASGRERLLGIANSNRDETSTIAAMLYLDLGGDFAELMPRHATTLPVILKLNPTELVQNQSFCEGLREQLDSVEALGIVCWLGKDASGFAPDLSELIHTRLVSRSYDSFGRYTEAVIGISGCRECFLPLCGQFLLDKQRYRCEVAMELLSIVGDPDGLYEPALRQLMESKTPSIRVSAQRCYNKVYPGSVDLSDAVPDINAPAN